MVTRYVHTNLVARDWRGLANFYMDVFGCAPVGSERDLHGAWLDAATGLSNARAQGIHLRLPGHGDVGPTLEIFQYEPAGVRSHAQPNALGYGHLAFAVDDVEETARRVLDAGGSAVGALTETTLEGSGRIVFQYVADPEGNIVEIQRWG